MKRNIAVLAGGDSAEIVISMQTARHIYNCLDKEIYKPFLVEIQGTNWQVKIGKHKYPVQKNDFSFIKEDEKVKFDFAYIAIHGTPGENGILQGYFHLLRIPHSSCTTLSSALSFNKHVCNSFLKSLGFRCANSILLKKDEQYSVEEIQKKLGMPCFVKPNSDGSSFGISKVNCPEDFNQAVKKAFKEGNETLVEEFIDGLELTCGLLKTRTETLIFPVTEILPKNEFFDFEAKYDPNMAEEITPARISKELTERIRKLSLKIYDALNCKGIVRIDFMIRQNEIFILEVNTVPGMTANSFIPKQIEAMNRSLTEILSLVIENEF